MEDMIDIDPEDIDLALVDWKATAENLQAIVTSVDRLCQVALDKGEPSIAVSDIRAVMYAARYGVS